MQAVGFTEKGFIRDTFVWNLSSPSEHLWETFFQFRKAVPPTLPSWRYFAPFIAVNNAPRGDQLSRKTWEIRKINLEIYSTVTLEKFATILRKFPLLRREGYQRGGWVLRGAGGAKFSERARFSRVNMFFCNCVFSVATLLLIIHITMSILKWYSKIIPLHSKMIFENHSPILKWY